MTVWLTGLPAAGKTTLAMEASAALATNGHRVHVLDGDVLRNGLNKGLGYSFEDRRTAIRRAGALALELARDGHVVFVAMISPLADERAAVRSLHEEERLAFLEVWVSTPIEECERRDPKGLFQRARAGELTGLTGIDSPYEAPTAADVEISTQSLSRERAVERLVAAIGTLRAG